MRLVACMFMVGIMLPACSLRAEIILDDFTDPVSVASPAMDNVFVETLNVGDLAARRLVRIASLSVDVLGAIDIGTSNAGQFVAMIGEIKQTDSLLPATSIQCNYFFSPTEITQGGSNDSILLDLASLTGDMQPTFFRAFAFAGTKSYELRLPALVSSDAPQTLAFRFEDFRTRGGEPGLDPSAIRQINFDFFFLGHTGVLNWNVQIDRVRFGSTAVPEPAAAAFSVFWGGLLVCCRGPRLPIRGTACV